MSPSNNILSMTQFLESNGMGAYVSMFEEHQIDSELLFEVTDGTLKEIGVTRPIDRVRILVGFRSLVQGPTYLSQEYSTEKIAEIIKLMDFKTEESERYCAIIEKYQIDGEVFQSVSGEVMKELGMKPGHYVKIKKKLT